MQNARIQQGSVLSSEDGYSLGLVDLGDSNKRAIIISHDCDLAGHSPEEFIEFIVGNLTDKIDSRFQNAKHPRRLHITFDSNGKFLYIELAHSNRKLIEKNKVLSIVSETNMISADEKRILKQWLAGRYGRPAFPN